MFLLNFDTFIFPRIVKLVYALGLLLVALGMGAGFFAGIAGMETTFATGAFLLVVTVIGGIVSAFAWRLVIELWLVMFSINDHLKAVREQGRPN